MTFFEYWYPPDVIDQVKTDRKNIMVVIIFIQNNKYYDLRNKNGTLAQMYINNKSTIIIMS